MRRYSFWLVPVTVASFLSIWWSPTFELRLPEPVAFETAADFRGFVQRHGFLIHSGRMNPEVHNNYFVSREPRAWEEFGGLSKARCGLTAKWKGVVWATANFVSTERTDGVLVHSLGGHYRIWGKVLVVGDADVLALLEQLYQQEQTGG